MASAPLEANGGLTIIRGRVRARLLGLQLLTLEAEIAVGPPDSHRAAPTLAGTTMASLEPSSMDGSGWPPLGRAALLLAEGDRSLGDARRLRRRFALGGDSGGPGGG